MYSDTEGRPLYLDVEHIDSPGYFIVELLALLVRDDCFRRILQDFWAKVKGAGDWLLSHTESIDIGEIKVEIRDRTDVPANWRSYGDRLTGLLNAGNPPLLLLIDEFPIMISRMAERDKEQAVLFLRWLRGVRLSPENRTRFVVGGSTNIMYSLEALGVVDTINDLSPIRLRPFTELAADTYLQTVFSSRGLTAPPEVKARILVHVGESIPYLLALYVQAILSRVQASDGVLDIGLVDGAFDDLLDSGAAVFLHYWSRLSEYYPGRESDVAKAILGLLSRADGPVQHDTLFQLFLKTSGRQPNARAEDEFVRLMWKLDNDFYIVRDDTGYRFFSRVLRLWWCRHYGYQREASR